MTLIDEHTRECVALAVDQSITSTHVIVVLDRLIGSAERLPLSGATMGRIVAVAIRRHPADLDVETRFIAPGVPSENGYIESFNGTLRNELLGQ